tara:strand:- start:768 stop:914 length:147 start_codon:yes stop_codon:yes gene_type:complete
MPVTDTKAMHEVHNTHAFIALHNLKSIPYMQIKLMTHLPCQQMIGSRQ